MIVSLYTSILPISRIRSRVRIGLIFLFFNAFSNILIYPELKLIKSTLSFRSALEESHDSLATCFTVRGGAAPFAVSTVTVTPWAPVRVAESVDILLPHVQSSWQLRLLLTLL